MRCDLVFDENRRILVIRIRANLELVKLLSVFDSLMTGLSESGTDKIVVDLQGTLANKISVDDIQYMSTLFELHAGTLNHKNIAFVISGMLGYGLVRQLEAFLPDTMKLNIEIFQQKDEALQWLTPIE